MIEKIEENDKTITKVHDLAPEESVLELARLIGGAQITNATMLAAKEMKQMAKK
jgi:DNA repair protein RecN (Recombination protein N)